VKKTLWVVATLFSLAAGAVLPAASAPEPQVTVREEGGIYTVSATFGVSQPPSAAMAVLTDYEQIPRFMSDVRSSHVLERSGDRAVVEQEAFARFMMFSKSVHLVLEIQEEGGAIRFRDRCGRSFARYDGAWVTAERDGYTAITYELSAKPSFEVPDFLLKRLLKRDATRMIERLQQEIAGRAR
jgi:ribosome-associated toxin RatA of RatAB toxin-antitoxin module